MAFHVNHRYGSTEYPGSVVGFPALLRELDERPDDEDHGTVSVNHESEWSLSVSRGGHVVFEHVEHGGERHMIGVPDAKIIELWTLLADGDIATIEREPWKPGYQ